jgi:hypothetical protein
MPELPTPLNAIVSMSNKVGLTCGAATEGIFGGDK